jgi:hypothetical protein
LSFLRGMHPTAGGRIPIGTHQARISTPGEHTVSIAAYSNVAGTLTVAASAGQPIFIRAVEH